MRRMRGTVRDVDAIMHLLPDEAVDQYPNLTLAAGLNGELARELARLVVNAYKYGQQTANARRRTAR